MPNENLRRYMDKDSLEALWNDTGQLISNLVESAAQDISDVAVQQAQAAADDSIRAAIDAVGDISELAVPLMSDVVRGGAKLRAPTRAKAGKRPPMARTRRQKALSSVKRDSIGTRTARKSAQDSGASDLGAPLLCPLRRREHGAYLHGCDYRACI